MHKSTYAVRSWLMAALFLLITLLPGCGEESAPPPPRIPAVKTIVVSASMESGTRSISGVIEAGESSVLAFPSSGTVAEVMVNIGDTVVAGDILARLDPGSYDIDVGAAVAQQEAAQADLLLAKEQYRRLEQLFDRGIVAKAELDNARAALSSAESALKLAQAKLAKARDDRRRTALVAPFDGRVSDRKINPFQEVAPGKPALTLVGSQELKARALVPETLAQGLQVGQPVTVAVPSLSEAGISARISEIGAVAEAGAGIPVLAVLESRPDLSARIVPGTTITLSLPVQEGQGVAVYLIPLSALAMNDLPRLTAAGGTGGRAPVFLFDAEQGLMERRLVEVAGLQGNMLAVSAGLNQGDEVVTAGTSFLEDGMSARRWEPETPDEEAALTTLERRPGRE